MPTANYGVGVYGTDSYDEVVYPTVLTTVREKPPLRVTMDIETPAGKHYRWAEDEPAPENVPSGLRWSDTMPGGFESLDCTLPRKSGIDYSDLEQLSTIRVLGASGDVAGEYRLERSPRTSGDEVSISPGAVGWQAHLEDDKSARVIYVDRDIGRWQEPNTVRTLALSGAGTPLGKIQARVGAPEGIVWEVPNEALPAFETSEIWYDSGVGLGVSFFSYRGTRTGAFTSFEAPALFGGPSPDTTSGSVGITLDDTNRIVAVTGLPRALMVRVSTSAGVTPAAGHLQSVSQVGVYGDHSLTGRDGGDGHFGYLASDVAADAVRRWASLLTATSESVQQSSFVIPHLAFVEPTTAGEIIRQVTRFGLQDWAVWENKTFWCHERGVFSKLWRSRVAPAQLDETGPQVDRLWESIIVQYQDVDDSAKTVGPPGSGADVEDASLKDSDPDNPANQLGIIRRDILQMGTTTVAGATEVGRRFLEESQLLDRSGRARIVGHVEDSSGVVHPYWRPRAGDYISFIDAADTSYRRIVKTDKSHSERTCGLDLDAPPEGLKALLERLGVVLVPLGLS